MIRCQNCGHEEETPAKFCRECGAPMVEATLVMREERKVVTVLFADLVGFTSRSEQLDPEDVRALLSPYYARLRSQLEAFGGTVEKFIGDAVMALFGAPVAHEDDPERAVRAAIAIRDSVLEDGADLQLRIAVNTGEALVALGARASQGEGMASGDVVNTTARLQTAAPVNGILVGEMTYRATAEVIDYRQAEPVSAKGKALPVPAWEALEARSRFGVDIARVSRAPLVGREQELAVLTDALARMRRERSTQLVTLVSVPGMGKSRLVAELFRVVDADPSELIVWRQGRSLPYGDGVTFWALSEMVKAQSGILETDTPAEADAKMHSAVAAVLEDDADARWVEDRLRPLVGIVGNEGGGGDRREEAFAAWRRFFEAIGERDPAVLVFEDLHWADDNLLDFIEHLIDWTRGVPLLLVCTARPELFERRATWGGGTRNSTTLWLTPLSEDDTSHLISNLSQRPLMRVETQETLLARAGGNPLYAEQYVRMLDERGDAAELTIPETVQGIIAARLDALPPEEKRLLQNAAVIGKVFWLGALTSIDGTDRRAAELQLHALERKDFVQRARRSSVADEAEYSFLHVLVRDVAYGQIPRAQRAEQHRGAAEWIASLGRTEDHAEMLAHHYANAIELLRASGQSIGPDLAHQALESLRDAGERAASLNGYSNAAALYESALGLAPAGTSEHADLLLRLGRTRHLAGDLDPTLLNEACAELGATGDREGAAAAEAALANVYMQRGDGQASFEHLGRARDLIAGETPTRVVAEVMGTLAGRLMMRGDNAEAIRISREGLAMAEQLGLDDVRARILSYMGVARCHGGDLDGVYDLEESVAVADAANAATAMVVGRANLASLLLEQGRLQRAFDMALGAEKVALRFGLMVDAEWLRGELVVYRFVFGRWQEALDSADEFIAAVEAGSPNYIAPNCYITRARIRHARGDLAGARADVARALELARLTNDPQMLDPTLMQAAHVLSECGDLDAAGVLGDEIVAALRAGRGTDYALVSTHILAWALAMLGRAEELIGSLPKSEVPWVQAARAYASGDLRAAAEICAGMGAVTEEAHDRLGLARELIAQQRRSEADVELQRALSFYRGVGATRYIRDAEALLAESA
jgi:class 3 adenylate cyclase/tetratricopeptide (TPR) repeat protein